MSEQDLNVKFNTLYAALEDKEDKFNKLIEFRVSTINTLSKEYYDIDLAKEELLTLHTTLSNLGCIDDSNTIYTCSVEEYDKFSLEDLDGERKGFIAKLDKFVTNFFQDIKAIGDDLDAVMKVMSSITSTKMTMLLEEVKSGKYTEVKDKIVSPSIASDLGVYFALGNKDININDMKELVLTTSTLLIKEKLFDSMIKYAYDNLVVSKDNETEIPLHTSSVRALDKFVLPEVRDWLNKDTKLGICNRYVGNKFRILTVAQDTEGAMVRYDSYSVPKEMYFGKELTPLSLKECEELINTGLELIDNSRVLANIGRVNAFDNMWKTLRSTVGTIAATLMFKPFALKRLFRQIGMADVYATSSYNVLIGLKKSHIDSLELIYKLVQASLTKKGK